MILTIRDSTCLPPGLGEGLMGLGYLLPLPTMKEKDTSYFGRRAHKEGIYLNVLVIIPSNMSHVASSFDAVVQMNSRAEYNVFLPVVITILVRDLIINSFLCRLLFGLRQRSNIGIITTKLSFSCTITAEASPNLRIEIERRKKISQRKKPSWKHTSLGDSFKYSDEVLSLNNNWVNQIVMKNIPISDAACLI